MKGMDGGEVHGREHLNTTETTLLAFPSSMENIGTEGKDAYVCITTDSGDLLKTVVYSQNPKETVEGSKIIQDL